MVGFALLSRQLDINFIGTEMAKETIVFFAPDFDASKVLSLLCSTVIEGRGSKWKHSSKQCAFSTRTTLYSERETSPSLMALDKARRL